MRNKHKALICFIIIITLGLLTLNIRYKLYPLSLSVKEPVEGYDLSFMCFNIHGSDQSQYLSNRYRDIYKMIKNEYPDVLFINEYYSSCIDSLDINLLQIYKYKYDGGRHDLDYGDVFYSKYPIETCYKLGADRDFIYNAIVRYDKKRVSVIGCHLCSNNYNEENVEMNIGTGCSKVGMIDYYKNYLIRESRREGQIKRIISQAKDTLPTIIMGDFNDICGSKPLLLIESIGFRDAWWEMGKGYGSTFENEKLLLRLDHIYYNNKLDIRSIKVIDCKLSDHRPLIGTFRIK